MDASTLFQYLFFFDRQAILAIATDASSPLFGLLLVLSAGLARNHARHDLIAQPWRILTPIAASLVTAIPLFLFVQFSLWIHASPTIPWGTGFWCVLGLYWATAPLAWIYGLPFEWLVGINRAEKARLISLGIVAAWRVALIFKVLLVFLDAGIFATLAILLPVESAIALSALILLSTRKDTVNRPRISSGLIEIMGGITIGPQTMAELNAGKWDHDKLLDTPPPFRSHAQSERVASVVVPVCIYAVIFGMIMNYWISPKATTWSNLQPSLGRDSEIGWMVSVVSVLLWVAIAFFSQPAQRRKSHVLSLLKKGDVQAAIRFLADRPPSAFPAAWEPPPSEDFRGEPSMLDVMEALATIKPGGWVSASYAPRIRHYVAHAAWYWHYAEELSRLCDVLEKMPEGPTLAKAALSSIDRHEQVMATCREIYERSKSEEAANPLIERWDSEPFKVFPPPSSASSELSTLQNRLKAIARI